MASAEDDFEYLSPSFDPSSLTMPRLRNILMSHDIAYPSSAKKSQLVDIFTQELKPKAHKILSDRDRVRRTSRGITDMPSSQEGTVKGDNDDDVGSMPPPPVSNIPRKRKSGKSMRVSAEPSVPAGGLRSSSKHTRQSDTETDLESKRPAIRKSRNIEEMRETPKQPPMRGDAFSNENPFQSGSSPLAPGENRRKSAGTSNDRRKSSSGRRKTEGVASSPTQQQDGINVPTAKTFDVPLSRMKVSRIKVEPDDDDTEAGEEFTPEEQLELVRERAANGEVDVLPPRKRKRSQKSYTIPRSAPWVILIALLGGYVTWWRQEKLAVGYCGIGRPSNPISSIRIPQSAEVLQPTCEPCPQHAICYQNMDTRCEHDFILQSHPLSLGGLIPLAPSCEPDGEKVRRVKMVADRAVEELRERKAQAECGTSKDSKGRDVSAEIDEQELKKEVGKKRRKGMDEAEFEDLWKGAIGEVTGREEVVSSSDGTHFHLSSTSLARLPFTCAVRRSARLTLARHRVTLSFVILAAIGLFYIRSLILMSRRDTARVPSLVATTLDRLATQAALQARGDAAESWISVGQLRDDILRDEFSDQRRERIWKRVRAVVERNANVRASVKEGRGGDMSRVWEWIGSIGLLEDGPYSGGKKRVSFGGVVGTGKSADLTTPKEGGDGREMSEKRQWNEGRPIF